MRQRDTHPEPLWRVEALLRQWQLRPSADPIVLERLTASAYWRGLLDPASPFGAAIFSLSDGAIVATTPYIEGVAVQFGITLSSSFSDLLAQVYPEDQAAFLTFMERISQDQAALVDASIRIRVHSDQTIWLKISSTHAQFIDPAATGYRLLIIQDVNAMLLRSGATVLEWSTRPLHAWNLLYPTSSESVPLTARELEIIRLLARGWGSKQIATHLGISSHTVDTHRSNMLFKTGCGNTPSLVRYAIEHGLS
jgi:DNA-binding CsgD family transcriptional regulator